VSRKSIAKPFAVRKPFALRPSRGKIARPTPEVFVGTRACLLSILLLSTPAAAEWRLAGQDGFSTIYYDPASRKTRDDGSVSVRALTDYDSRSPEAASFRLPEKGLSEIEEAAFDCTKKTFRSGGGAWFEGQMATGAVRNAYAAKDSWSKVPGFYASLFSRVCSDG
jgi:hypothetical protein